MPQDAEPAESKNGGAAPKNGGPAPDGTARDGDGASGIGSFVYKLALAGVGALMLAQEEIEAAWKRTRRERGEDAPADGTAPSAVDGAAPAAETAPEVQASTAGSPDGSRVWLQIDQAIGRVLRSLNIPTRDEVNQIGTKIDALVEKLEARDRS